MDLYRPLPRRTMTHVISFFVSFLNLQTHVSLRKWAQCPGTLGSSDFQQV